MITDYCGHMVHWRRYGNSLTHYVYMCACAVFGIFQKTGHSNWKVDFLKNSNRAVIFTKILGFPVDLRESANVRHEIERPVYKQMVRMIQYMIRSNALKNEKKLTQKMRKKMRKKWEKTDTKMRKKMIQNWYKTDTKLRRISDFRQYHLMPFCRNANVQHGNSKSKKNKSVNNK